MCIRDRPTDIGIPTARSTWKELNGESCISIEELPQKKSICTSRSFANEGITDKNVIEEAVANFADVYKRQELDFFLY